MKKLKFIIVDDNEKFRASLKFYLEQILNYNVIGEAGDGEVFLQLPQKSEADIILMDISMPKLNGIAAAKTLLRDTKHKIIAITSYEDKTYINELIESGIKGCVFKKDIHENLNDAVLKVLNNELYFPKSIAMKINKKNGFYKI